MQQPQLFQGIGLPRRVAKLAADGDRLLQVHLGCIIVPLKEGDDSQAQQAGADARIVLCLLKGGQRLFQVFLGGGVLAERKLGACFVQSLGPMGLRGALFAAPFRGAGSAGAVCSLDGSSAVGSSFAGASSVIVGSFSSDSGLLSAGASSFMSG